MIEPGDLYKHFAVRVIATGQTVRLNGARDLRYAVTGPGLWDYQPCPDGDYFLADSPVWSHPWGYPLRLDEVEPLPDGAGLYHPAVLWLHELSLERSYVGSWREYADAQRVLIAESGERYGEAA